MTRPGARDWLGRPRVAIHLYRVSVRRNTNGAAPGGGRGGGGDATSFFQMCAHRLRGDGAELEVLRRSLEEEHGLRPSTVATHERAELAIKWARLEDIPRSTAYSDSIRRVAEALDGDAAPEFLNPELSLLSFQHRVLSLAEDPLTPLRERLRFLSIVSANVDEFFMVRMARLTASSNPADEIGDDGLTLREELAAIGESVATIAARQARCFRECLTALAARGIRLRTWSELSESQVGLGEVVEDRSAKRFVRASEPKFSRCSRPSR